MDVNKEFDNTFHALHKMYESTYGTLITRDCDNCGVGYHVREANFKRGWGRSCSKSCAAELREKNKKTTSRTEIFKVL